MDQKMHDKGPEVRRAVLGEAFVNNPLKNVDSSNKPFLNPLNEYCWGSVWGRDELPRKTRSHARHRDDLDPEPAARAARRAEQRRHARGDPRDPDAGRGPWRHGEIFAEFDKA